MTDREMLELAARAAGIKGKVINAEGLGAWIPMPGASSAVWNPLDDDGDTQRLAVDLRFETDVTDSGVAVRTKCGLKVLVSTKEEPDLRAAARLATFRAAAEIGRQMGETT